MKTLVHLSMAELEAGLDEIRQSPKDNGLLKMIVKRPSSNNRVVLSEGELSLSEGLVGDCWKERGSGRTPDGSSHPEMQLNIMNSRVIDLLAQDKERWELAGDQLFVDLDLSVDNLPPGTQLRVGTAVIEITDQVHAGCDKFATRFGRDALRFVNGPTYKSLKLRGLNAKVVQPGIVRADDVVSKVN
ncbi:MAG: MOSC domain-containing protein [Chloroflexi bacterium]|nr:MAG: MOSC domain-containing protein [Chloroflexota bacterium]